jgi:hypothetical protein
LDRRIDSWRETSSPLFPDSDDGAGAGADDIAAAGVDTIVDDVDDAEIGFELDDDDS